MAEVVRFVAHVWLSRWHPDYQAVAVASSHKSAGCPCSCGCTVAYHGASCRHGHASGVSEATASPGSLRTPGAHRLRLTVVLPHSFVLLLVIIRCCRWLILLLRIRSIFQKSLRSWVLHCALALVALVAINIHNRFCIHRFLASVARQLPRRLSVFLLDQVFLGLLAFPRFLARAGSSKTVSGSACTIPSVDSRKVRFLTSTSRTSTFDGTP